MDHFQKTDLNHFSYGLETLTLKGLQISIGEFTDIQLLAFLELLLYYLINMSSCAYQFKLNIYDFSILGRSRKYRIGRFELDRWVDTSRSERTPRGQGDVSTMAWFRPTESGLGLYKGEIGHCENAPIGPSHTPQQSNSGQYDGRMSKPTDRAERATYKA